jgi:hypothetical protein
MMLDPEAVRAARDELTWNPTSTTPKTHAILFAVVEEWLADREGPTDAQIEAAAAAIYTEDSAAGDLPWSDVDEIAKKVYRQLALAALVAARMVEGDEMPNPDSVKADRLTRHNLRAQIYDIDGLADGIRPVTLADLVEVIESEGGVVATLPGGVLTAEVGQFPPGRYLVLRLPDEKNNEGEST